MMEKCEYCNSGFCVLSDVDLLLDCDEETGKCLAEMELSGVSCDFYKEE